MINNTRFSNSKILVAGILIIALALGYFLIKISDRKLMNLSAVRLIECYQKLLESMRSKMQVRGFYPDPLYKFGQLLFFDPVLSEKAMSHVRHATT